MPSWNRMQTRNLVLEFVIFAYVCGIAFGAQAWIGKKSVSVVEGNSRTFTLHIKGLVEQETIITADIEQNDIISVVPNQFIVNSTTDPEEIQEFHGCVSGGVAGHALLYFDANPNTTIEMEKVYLRVTVQKNESLTYVSLIIGWLYFVAWSISFYPQIYMNFKRRSVVGLNFDFISLNLVGFFLYSVFNCGLYFIPAIKMEYSQRYPRGVIPVQLNDIFFGLHALIATFITITQCFCYERDNQRVSFTAKCILTAFTLFIFCSGVAALSHFILWLDFLGFCSYVKLCITLIKYMPQAYMNYKRKSTVGWSIGNIFLDCTGGVLSMLQMMLNAYNYNDWVSVFGDLTKFGLGLFSVIFDIFFIVQHYILYRDRYEEIPGGTVIHQAADDDFSPDEELIADNETNENADRENYQNAKMTYSPG